MKDFVIIKSDDIIEELLSQKILIFSDVENYEEEIFIKLENNINYKDLEKFTISVGGKLEIILLDHLVKFYQKNK